MIGGKRSTTPAGMCCSETGKRGGRIDDRSALCNMIDSQQESLPGSLTTEIDHPVRAQAPTVPQPGGVPEAGCELCTLQVRSDQIFGSVENWDEDEFDHSDYPELADMLQGNDSPPRSPEQADLYKAVQVSGPASLQRGIRAIDEEFKDTYGLRS